MVEACHEALRVEPRLVPGHTNLGVAYLKAEGYDLAVGVFRGGLDYASGELQLNVGLVLSCLSSGDGTAAGEHYRQLDLGGPKLGIPS